MNLNEFTAHELLEKLESQEISAEAIVLACFEQIDNLDIAPSDISPHHIWVNIPV